MKVHLPHMVLIMITTIICLNPDTKGQYIYEAPPRLEIYTGVIDKSNSHLKKIPFSNIKIIDNRRDTISIGFRKTKILCYTNDSLQIQSLQYFIDQYYNEKCDGSTGDTLVIFIEKLSIRDEVHYIDLASDSWQMHCKFFIGSNHSYRYAGNLVREEYGDKKWNKYLFKIFDAAIEEAMNSLKKNNLKAEPVIDPDSLYLHVTATRSIPILTQPLKAGFYYNFNEFKNNDPGFTYANDSSLANLLKEMHYKSYLQNLRKKKSREVPDTTYWGYCDGRRIFIRNGKNFYQVGRFDHAIYFLPLFSGIEYAQDEKIGNVIGGLVSMGISSMGSSSSLPYYYSGHVTPVPYIEILFANQKTAAITLDLDTGNFVF